MNELSRMLRNQTVNNLATAFIFGGATLAFFSSVANMIFGDLFNTGAVWEFKVFLTDLVVYIALVVVAWWVNSMARG